MKKYIYRYGPIKTRIYPDPIMYYKSGIVIIKKDKMNITEETTTHAVTIIGWGHNELYDLDYWIVRNSWGEDWGMNGYMLVKAGDNVMGIEDYVCFIGNSNYFSYRKILVHILIFIFLLF